MGNDSSSLHVPLYNDCNLAEKKKTTKNLHDVDVLLKNFMKIVLSFRKDLRRKINFFKLIEKGSRIDKYLKTLDD